MIYSSLIVYALSKLYFANYIPTISISYEMEGMTSPNIHFHRENIIFIVLLHNSLIFE
jgi:hypothetical protein